MEDAASLECELKAASKDFSGLLEVPDPEVAIGAARQLFVWDVEWRRLVISVGWGRRLTPGVMCGWQCAELNVMGARANENKMTLLVDIDEFYDRVGLVWDYYELEWLGFKPFDYCGHFYPEALPQLMDFCRLNPEYHIVSGFRGGRKINKLVPEARCFWLANGDRDPSLMLNFLLDPNLPLVMEEVITAAAAVFRDIKNRGE